MSQTFPDVPETPQGWLTAVIFGLIGMTLFGLFDGLVMAFGTALCLFALTDAYLIADTLDELEDAPDVEAIADGGSYEVRKR